MHALREAFAAVRRAPLLTALSAAMVALALFVVGLFGLVAHNLHLTLDRIEDRVEVVAYLRDDVRSEELAITEQELTALPEVDRVRYVSKDDALIQARQEMSEFQELFADLEFNPLPASLELALVPGNRDPETVARISEQVGLYPFVEDVRYGEEWVERLFLLRHMAGITAGVLGAGFALVAALIIATAIRIAIFARREEIFVMRLVGAKDGFIRRPFLLEGLFTGLVGGLFAVLLTYSAYAAVYSLIFPLEWLPPEWVLFGVLVGGGFGLVASTFAVRRYLREV